MKKSLLMLTCLVLLFSAAGCSNILEPTKPEDSLLIGQLTLKAQGWDDFMGTSVNGNLKGAISMDILNVDTNKTYVTSTSLNGFFSKINPESGTYKITRMVYQSNNSQASHTLSWYPQFSLKYINVEPGKVVNIGCLTWFAVKGIKSAIIIDNTPEYLKEIFTAKFPKSLWLEREWVNVKPF